MLIQRMATRCPALGNRGETKAPWQQGFLAMVVQCPVGKYKGGEKHCTAITKDAVAAALKETR
ncbi:hypothetical protein GCM10027395_00210 [Giesbergeria sinuosa]